VKKKTEVLPIFDDLHHLIEQKEGPEWVNAGDYRIARDFLLSYRGSVDTFNAYRREVERLMQWCTWVQQKTFSELTRADLEVFIDFSRQPFLEWIGTEQVSRFFDKNGLRLANPPWRPFLVKVSKAEHKEGLIPDRSRYQFSVSALHALFRILSTFFSFLEMEDYVLSNPIKKIRQKSQYLMKSQGKNTIRRLSDLQWDFVIETTAMMAVANPQHERTLFIMQTLYLMYLRISELAQSSRWLPMMRHFYQDHDGQWWFNTLGKGNKSRDVSVSDAMLQALRRYRIHLGLPALPSPNDSTPLLAKNKGRGAIHSTRQIRKIVQDCFDAAILRMEAENLKEESLSLKSATVHWLRHTGISDDVKNRPREHVRDDAGHASSATTDKYIDIDRRERYQSGKNKSVRPLVSE